MSKWYEVEVTSILNTHEGTGASTVPATPELIAELFASMSSDEQAAFFNHVAEVSNKWDSSFPFQLQYITDEDGLTLSGRRVMQEIGDYSHWGLVPHGARYD